MNITFRQLRLFLALAETGSVSAAAKVMHVTQPTASMQLREVTQAVGVPLYEVVSRRVYLTEAGQALARTARAIASEWDAFEQGISGAKGLTSGRLESGGGEHRQILRARFAGQLLQAAPANRHFAGSAQPRPCHYPPARQPGRPLRDVHAPRGICRWRIRSSCPTRSWSSPPQATGWPPRKRVTLAQLQGERFILREKGSGTRMATDAHLRQLGFAPSAVLELGSNEAIKESVEGQLGVSIVSRHALGPHWDGLAILNVQGFPIQSQWHLVWPKGKRLSPIAEVFRGHLIAQAAGWMQGR